MDLGIRGRSAIVCASSHGLGKGCALALGREGAEVTPGPPADLKLLIAEEIVRWRKLAAEGRIHAE